MAGEIKVKDSQALEFALNLAKMTPAEPIATALQKAISDGEITVDEDFKLAEAFVAVARTVFPGQKRFEDLAAALVAAAEAFVASAPPAAVA